MTVAGIVPLLAVAVALFAAFTDIKERRISNRLTYSAVVAGFALQAVLHGLNGLLLSMGGAALFGGVFLLFYIVRVMGAGDVKLAAALGSIVGFSATRPLMLETAVSGAALAVLFMVWSGRVTESLRNTFSIMGFHLRHGLKIHPVINLDSPTGVRMPYGLAFAAGTVYWAASVGFWR
jgi:prepilin peptidase CpaA